MTKLRVKTFQMTILNYLNEVCLENNNEAILSLILEKSEFERTVNISSGNSSLATLGFIKRLRKEGTANVITITREGKKHLKNNLDLIMNSDEIAVFNENHTRKKGGNKEKEKDNYIPPKSKSAKRSVDALSDTFNENARLLHNAETNLVQLERMVDSQRSFIADIKGESENDVR